MDPLDILRCPIDPQRSAALHRERDRLVCDGCGVRYPVKHGIPVLIAEEADLPPDCASADQLPCQRQARTRLG